MPLGAGLCFFGPFLMQTFVYIDGFKEPVPTQLARSARHHHQAGIMVMAGTLCAWRWYAFIREYTRPGEKVLTGQGAGSLGRRGSKVDRHR